MSETIIQQIWKQTLQSIGEDSEFGERRVKDIQEAIQENDILKIESILNKEYENK